MVVFGPSGHRDGRRLVELDDTMTQMATGFVRVLKISKSEACCNAKISGDDNALAALRTSR